MFKRFRSYIRNKGLCFTFASKSKKVTVSICADIGAARIKTPFSDDLINIADDDYGTNLIPALVNAYKLAEENKDEDVMNEIHSIRQVLAAV